MIVGIMLFITVLVASQLVRESHGQSSSSITPLGSIPRGTIVAFMGMKAPDGWLLCDGNDIPTGKQYMELIHMLRKTKTPNLQGYFLRGLDPKGVLDKDREGKSPGDIQKDTTKMPELPFTTVGNGAHNHVLPSGMMKDGKYQGKDGQWGHNGGGYRGWIYHHPDMKLSANTSSTHTHTITGGDSETRPHNIAVNYIIKH